MERISEYVETPLTVTSLAISDGNEQIIICSCDLISIGENLIGAVREKVNLENQKIDTNKIIISAIHTHTSHVYDRSLKFSERSTVTTEKSIKEIFNSFSPEEKQYQAKAVPKGSVIESWENRKPARYAQGFGRAAIGMCRRVCHSDGSAKMWGDTNSASFTELEGGNDSGIEMLFFYDENKKLTGIMANVACPAQVLEHKYFMSSDYWGKVKALLREKYGDDIDVENTYDEAVLKHEKFIVDLPLRRVTLREYAEAVEALQKYAFRVKDHIDFDDNAKMQIYTGTIYRYEQQQTKNLEPAEVHIARIGNVAIATNPFELFLDYGNQIRARSRARQTFLIQLACGKKGYLPTEKAENGGHYSAYVQAVE